MKYFKPMMALLVLLHISIGSRAQTEILSAGSDFSFSFLQNRLLPNHQPMSDDHYEISLMMYVSNAEATSTDVNISFSGNDNLSNYIRFKYKDGGSTVEKTEADFSLAVDETKEVEIIITEEIEWFSSSGSSRGFVDDKALAMMMNNGEIQNKVFRVKTTNSTGGNTNKVTVFAESSQLRSRDAALILPHSALGNEYYIFTAEPPTGAEGQTYNVTRASANGNHGGPSEIVVTAIEDNTYIEVHYKDATTDPWGSILDNYSWNHVAGVNHFLLNAGESVQLQSDDYDLTGTYIRGFRNHPLDVTANETPIKFAVFSGNMATNASDGTSGAYDHVYEQMYPISTWSCRYIAANTLYNTPTLSFDDKKDYYRVLTAKDNTSITIKFGSSTGGTSTTTTLDVGEAIEIDYGSVNLIATDGTSSSLEASYSYGTTPEGIILFEADGPIAVVQITASNAQTSNAYQDPSMTMLSPVDQPIDEISFPLPPRKSSTSAKEDRLVAIREKGTGQTNLQYTVTQGATTNTTTMSSWTTLSTNTSYEYSISKIDLTSFNVDDPMSIKLEYVSAHANNKGFNAYIYGFDDKEAYGCAAGISALPTGVGPEKTVCVEPGGSITDIQLSAFGGNYTGGGETYTWDIVDGPGSFESSNTIASLVDDENAQNPIIDASLTETGLYIFSCTIKRDGTCDITWNQKINIVNCCEARINDHYETRYSTDETITDKTTIWNNKVYIDDNVTLTIDGGVLDVTDVDVVMGQCVHIVLENGAILRANNSVFRACNYQFPWHGITFESDAGSDNQINESSFKNAIRALEFKNNGSLVSNNLFYNNYEAIAVDYAVSDDFYWPISGNRFVVDGRSVLEDPQELFWVSCGETLLDNEHRAILANNATFLEPISQNEFLSSFEAYPHEKEHVGIAMDNSNATVSSNTFTNMFKSVSLTDVDGNFVIQSNQIELTTGKANISPQIEVFASTAIVSIGNNEMNSINTSLTAFKHLGIYAESSSGIDIYANEITGFNVGILAKECDDLAILNNHILNAMSYGVYVSGDGSSNEDVNIGCNEIDMDFNTGGLYSVGIGFKSLSTNTNIYSNCILDCYVAIYGEASVLNVLDVPFIWNNFLYNYYASGLYTEYYNSPAPSGLSSIRANTFFSNMYSGSTYGAWDVFAKYNTSTFGANFSFGMGVTSSNVTVSGSTTTYSTASCAKQVYYADGVSSTTPSLYLLDPDMDCDGSLDNWFGTFTRNEESYISYFENPLGASQEWNGPNTENDYVGTMKALAFTKDLDALHALHENVMQLKGVSPQEKLRLEYHYQVALKEWKQARALVAQITPNNQEEADWKSLEILQLDLLLNKQTARDLDEASLSILEQIIAHDNGVSDRAVALYNQARGGMENSYLTLNSPSIETADKTNSQKLGNTDLVAYPNPANDQVSLMYSAGFDNPVLEVIDALGKKVTVQTLSISQGVISLDVSSLQSGMYMVSVYDGTDTPLTTKFVKK